MREYFFQSIKSLILERKIGGIITRSELVWQAVDYYRAGTKREVNSSIRACLDLVIRCFREVKILKICGRGEYEIISRIPDNISYWNSFVMTYNIQFPRYGKNRKRKSSRA